MAAHLRLLARCTTTGCERYPTQELFNGANARLGKYCAKHAVIALAAHQRVLAEWDRSE